MPGLIDILGRQNRKPDEIIVIDSESEDATVRMAEQAGFRTLKVKGVSLTMVAQETMP